MNTLIFLATLITFGIVLFWYVRNEQMRADGTHGLLALQPDPVKASEKKAYRMKRRVMPKVRARNIDEVLSNAKAQNNAPINPETADRMRRKFRRQDEVRYRVKDKKRGAERLSDDKTTTKYHTGH